MKDAFNNELHIGDKIIFIYDKNKDASLKFGIVTKFYKGYFNKEECSVDNHTHIQSNRVARIDKLKEIKNAI